MSEYVLPTLSSIALCAAIFFVVKNLNRKALLEKRILELIGSPLTPSVTVQVSPAVAADKLIKGLGRTHQGWSIVSQQLNPFHIVAKHSWTGTISRGDYYGNSQTERTSLSVITAATTVTLEASIAPASQGSQVKWNYKTESKNCYTGELTAEDLKAEGVRLLANQCILQEFELLPEQAR